MIFMKSRVNISFIAIVSFFSCAPHSYPGHFTVLNSANYSGNPIIKGRSYFIYHNDALAADAGGFHRSVCIDDLYYNRDGTIKRVIMTSEGVKAVSK